jgi:hypothetical protein
VGAALRVFTGLAAPATAGDVVTSQDLIPDKFALLPESALWDTSVTLRTGLGYKDNVPLSTAPQGSPFFTSGLDLLLYRLPMDGLDATLLVTGDDTRYWRNPDGIYKEDLFLASGQLTKHFGTQWQAGLEVRGIYADQVVEELIAAGGVQAVEARGYTLAAKPFIRRNLGDAWWVQLEAPVSHEWWQFPLDDYWKFGGQAVVGFAPGPRSQLSLSYGGFYLPHDEWLAADAQGQPLGDNTKLAIWRQSAELKWEQAWDAARHWRSTTKLGFQYDQDNGGGWFDYYRYQASQELAFRTRDWEIRGSASVGYQPFLVQTVSAASGLNLYLTTVELTARVERRVYKELRVFGQFTHEQSVSNDSSSEYKANTATGGLSYEF